MSNVTKSQFGPFLIDVRERTLTRDGQRIPLTPKSFDLLVVFVEQAGRLIPKEELLQRVWPDTFVEESNLSYTVFALRKALGDTAETPQYIETVPKRGYRFRVVLTPVDDDCGASPAVSSASNAVATSQIGERPAGVSRRWIAWAIMPALAGVLYLPARWWRAATDEEPSAAVPLTSISGVVRSPSFSPDGNYVAFARRQSAQSADHIYVQQIGAGAPLPLTRDPTNDYSPSWSPDGRTIAFLRRSAAAAVSEILLIAPLGGVEKKVADVESRIGPYRPHTLCWCPDSQCIIVTDSPGRGKADALFVIAVESGAKRQITFPENATDVDPAMSPDGRTLVFRRDTTPFTGAFYRLALKAGVTPDGEPVRLTSPLSAGRPTWTPDGREIVFGDRGALWRLDAVHGGSPARLPYVGQDGLTPVVAATARRDMRLVYVRSFADRNVWRLDVPSPGAPAMTAPIPAIAAPRSESIASLSPDGRRVVFLSDRSGDLQLWVADADGANAFQLTTIAFASTPGFPRWSPDGKTIAFHGDPNARPALLAVPARGGEPRLLPPDLANAGFPNYSADGRWIYFCRIVGTDKRIWKIPAEGGTPVQVTPNDGTRAIESPDGRDLYYAESVERPGALWRLPLSGGSPVKLLDDVVLGNFDVVDGGIYYMQRVAGEARLQYFDLKTRQSSTVAAPLGNIAFGLSVSRDGRAIFFSRVDSAIDELMIVEKFR